MNKITILLTLFLLAGSLRSQAVLNVPTLSYPTIQSAVNAAASGDTVMVAPGTYFENVVFGSTSVNVIGAGRGLSFIDGGGIGSCLKFTGSSSTVVVVDGFSLQNGKGEIISPITPTHFVGGGILVVSQIGHPTQTIRNCEIVNCAGYIGSAVYVDKGYLTVLDNVEIHNCSIGTGSSATPGSIVQTDGGNVNLHLSNCHVHSNVAQIIIGSSQTLTLADCLIENNTAQLSSIVQAGQSDFPSFRRTAIVNNTVPNDSSVIQVTAQLLDFGDCLIANNTGGISVVVFDGPPGSEVSNLTIANNQLGTSPIGVIFTGPQTSMSNFISWGNTDANGSVAPAHIAMPSPYVGVVRNSIIENGTALGSTVLSVDPLFVDAANGDYRLLPGSPAIDHGTSNVAPTAYYPNFATQDIDGQPRIKGSAVDAGCYEAQSIATDSAATGRVGEFAGGPYDVLLINGSAGGPFRTVQVPIGAASVMTLVQPPNLSSPVQFSIFGLLGRAELEYVYNVPLGIGDMCFAPAPLFPSYQTFLFTYASTVGPLNGVVPFLPAGPTPWSSGAGPSIPFPLTLSFQGVIEEAPGVFVPTNVVILEVN